MEKRSSKGEGRLFFACAFVAATLCMTVVAQADVSARASVSASHADRLQKFNEDGSSWYEIVAKDTYNASATFTFTVAPADWTELVDTLTVTVGYVDCSPTIVTSTSKGGSAKLTEKDKETKSTLTCAAKWSKNAITVFLSGNNYDETTVMDGSGDGAIEEDVELTLELGDESYSVTIPMRGKLKTTVKKVKSGKGRDATTDEYDLVTWSAKGSASVVLTTEEEEEEEEEEEF